MEGTCLRCFLSLSKFLEKDYEKSLNYLKKALGEVKTINNPKEIGEIYFVETIIRDIIDKKDDKSTNEMKKIFKGKLWILLLSLYGILRWD